MLKKSDETQAKKNHTHRL